MNHPTHHVTGPETSHRGLYLGASAVAGVICVVLAVVAPSQFWPGFLVAANFWVSIALGCLGISLIHAITGGRWGYALGRGLQAGAATLPLVLGLGLFLCLGATYVFPWARHEFFNKNQVLYLDPWFVFVRYIVMGLMWIVMAIWLRGLYIREAADRTKFPPQGYAGACMMIFFLTVSFAAIDFQMALSPGWASSIFTLIRILNCAVSAMAVMILSRLIHTQEPHHNQQNLTHDAGNWLQAFNMLWTYLSFDQFILIWGADIPMEVQYYVDRHSTMGRFGSLMLFLFHWLVPFLLLLYRPLKKSYRALPIVAGLLLFMCFVDISWGTLFSIPGAGVLSFVSGLIAVVAIGGLWVVEYSRQYAKLPDMIVSDPHAAHHVHDDEIYPAGETV